MYKIMVVHNYFYINNIIIYSFDNIVDADNFYNSLDISDRGYKQYN